MGARVGAAVVCLVIALSAFSPWCSVSAFADPYAPPAAPSEPAVEPPECPAAPADAAERQYSDDLASLCRALAYRLDRVRERAYWAVSELKEVQRRQDEQAAALGEAVCVADCLGEAGGAGDAAEAEYTERIVSAVDASGEGSVGALYLIAGLLAALFVGAALMKVMDRAS